MQHMDKKKIQEDYKGRAVTGGIYAIRNTLTNRIFLDASTDLQASQNRFEFAQKTGSCVHYKLQKDWAKQESGSFTYEVLEELQKGDTQTQEEFKSDIGVLMEIWQEKLSGESLY